MSRKKYPDDPELLEILLAERDALYEGMSVQRDKDKWEEAWDSSRMINITRERLAKFPHPIPLKGLQSTLQQRIGSRLLDYALVLVALVALDLVGLFRIVEFTRIFGSLTLEPAQYQYSTLLDPTGMLILVKNPLVLKKMFLFAGLILLIYRMFFFVFLRRTLGQMIAGVQLVDLEGHYPSLLQRVTKGVVSTLSDVSVVGPFLDMILYAATGNQLVSSDAVSGIRAVQYESWKNLVSDLIHRLSQMREVGVVIR